MMYLLNTMWDTVVVILNGVVIIGEETFVCNKNITNAVIPDSVERIDTITFWDCRNSEMYR